MYSSCSSLKTCYGRNNAIIRIISLSFLSGYGCRIGEPQIIRSMNTGKCLNTGLKGIQPDVCLPPALYLQKTAAVQSSGLVTFPISTSVCEEGSSLLLHMATIIILGNCCHLFPTMLSAAGDIWFFHSRPTQGDFLPPVTAI